MCLWELENKRNVTISVSEGLNKDGAMKGVCEKVVVGVNIIKSMSWELENKRNVTILAWKRYNNSREVKGGC